MTTLQEKIAVMQAYAAGGKLQYRLATTQSEWKDWRDGMEPDFSWGACDYRIKREPREFYLVSRPQMVGLQVCEADGGVPGDALSCILVREVID